MNDNLKTILQEMCQRVGADFNSIDFKKKDWFIEYTWTEEQQESFKMWLITFLSKKEQRVGVSQFPGLANKKILKNLADGFIFNYGWKTNYDKI